MSHDSRGENVMTTILLLRKPGGWPRLHSEKRFWVAHPLRVLSYARVGTNRRGQTGSFPYSPYGFSIRTSENFRKSWSNVATGVSSARAAAASKQSTK